jgi:uncharacterized protein YqiB (DUF1249 family)
MKAAKRDYLKRILTRRSFAGLMDLYEENYRLLQTLAPDLDQLSGTVISRVAGSKDLYLTIQEKCKFTTTISLTYFFELDEGETIADPDLVIRIYYDARQAEAMACRPSGFMALENTAEKKPYMDCRWESNLFVEKWLRYCIKQGYRFTRETTLESKGHPEETLLELTD